MLTACGSKETTSNETASTETTSVESTEMTATEAAVAEPTAKPAEIPTESEAAPAETPAESPAPAVEPTTAPVEPTAVSTGYTYSELNQTMYAKSAVNVRDLPSTDGKKIGSLKASQEIVVTGKCDQTGWYRFDWNNTIGYVSDKYIVSEKPAVNTVASANNSSNTAGNQYASNTGTDEFGISDAVIENFMKTHGNGGTGNTTTGNTSTTNDYFDRAAAEQIFALVNAERTAAGIPALTWSEDMYNIAVQRCYEDDVHAGVRAGTIENYTTGDGSDAAAIHQKWHDSEGHRNTYMRAEYTYGAVAVRLISNTLGGIQLEPYHIAYEVFDLNNTAANSSVTINTPAQDDSVAAAPKTADENTDTSSSNVGWSMTPPTQEDGLKKWQEQNPDVEVSFGN
ncbi:MULTISPECIES: SH3 domain-containing protein [Clostridia]|jgi:uncharacterized protein YkwD|uniref:SH3 domain-containing protein n=1 Tax=Clostridia TaxID=186801 RepID=UPI000E48975C|nr:SH3 domain-containing protein [Clostridium sp. AF34-10BH]RHP37336.1 hypothetical protein DWZ61_01965 [Clostridium sp. AF34-10BH]